MVQRGPESLETKPPFHVAEPWLTPWLTPCCHHHLAGRLSTAGGIIGHRLKWPPGQAQGLTFVGQKEKRMQVRNVLVPVRLQVTFNTNKSSVYTLKSPGVDSCQASLDPGTQIMLLELGLTPPLRFVFLWSTSSGGLFSRHGDPWKLQVLQEKTDSQSFSKSHWAHAGALSSQAWETVQRGGSLASSEPRGLRVEDQSFPKVKLRFFC